MTTMTRNVESSRLYISEFKPRVYLIVFGLIFLMATIPLIPKNHPTTPLIREGQTGTNALEISINSTCSGFGSLLGCVQIDNGNLR